MQHSPINDQFLKAVGEILSPFEVQLSPSISTYGVVVHTKVDISHHDAAYGASKVFERVMEDIEAKLLDTKMVQSKLNTLNENLSTIGKINEELHAENTKLKAQIEILKELVKGESDDDNSED